MSLDGMSHVTHVKRQGDNKRWVLQNVHLWSFFNLCSTYWSTTALAPFDVTMSATRSLVDTRSRTISKTSAWQQSSRRHRPSSGGGRRGGRLRPGASSCLSSVSPPSLCSTVLVGGLDFAAILLETPPIGNSVGMSSIVQSLSRLSVASSPVPTKDTCAVFA